MKKLLIALGLALLFGPLCPAFAAEPVFAVAWPESEYGISQSTISISSTSVTTVAGSLGYRLLSMGEPTSSTTVYYRIDGSASNIPTVGWWFIPSQGHSIESNADVKLQLGAGASSVIIRILEKIK